MSPSNGGIRGNPGDVAKSFESQTPRSVRMVNADPASLSQITAIDHRTNRVKTRAREHYGKFVETWVAKEAITLWKQRSGLSPETAPKTAIGKEFAASGIMADARRNVAARMTTRLTNINQIRTRMNNSVVRNLQSMQPMQAQAVKHGEHSPKKGPQQ